MVSGEKVVQGGREAHRECFDSRKTETVVTSNLSTAEQCPLCQKTVNVQGEVKIIAGKAWHKVNPGFDMENQRMFLNVPLWLLGVP